MTSQLPGSIAGAVHLCGFGPIAAAARCASLIAEYRPQSVTLVGIAGAYRNRVPIGSAVAFDQVVCWGIGASAGTEFQGPTAIGFPQWSERTPDGEPLDIFDELALEVPAGLPRAAQLLTAPAASGDAAEVELRLTYFPGAAAEDLEGFAVALAARLAGCPLTIIRGISNQAGDRRTDSWQVRPAMAAAAQLLLESLDGRSSAPGR